jgi:hypothetical protein
MKLPRPLVGKEVRLRMAATGETHYTQAPGQLSFFRYHPVPLFPTQEVYGLSVWVCVHANNIAQIRAGVELSWTIYADDSRPIQSQRSLMDFHVIQRATKWVEQQLIDAEKAPG